LQIYLLHEKNLTLQSFQCTTTKLMNEHMNEAQITRQRNNL